MEGIQVSSLPAKILIRTAILSSSFMKLAVNSMANANMPTTEYAMPKRSPAFPLPIEHCLQQGIFLKISQCHWFS